MALFGQLVRIRHVHLAFAVPKRALLLGGRVLDPDLFHARLLEPADEMRVPKLGPDAEIFAASHECVGLAALDGGGQLVGAEEAVLALCLGDKSATC